MISVDPTDDKIREFLENNSLDRNIFLNSLLSIIELSNDGVILNVNGQWGSGKTVLAKEIDVLSVTELAPNSIDDEILLELRNNYSVFYYNAWESDQYDPAESIAFQLINRFWGMREKIANKVLSFVKPFITEIVNRGTLGLINANETKECEYIQGLFDGVRCFNERRDAAREIVLNALKEDDKKCLLFIVDKLDRCNPDFAVKLIEVVKHYFSDGPIKVLFLTNNLQLSSIIENSYGEKFSGYEYLDKIFDLIIDIPVPERRHFIDAYASDLEDYQRNAIAGVAEYYGMSLREMERFVVLFRISERYMESSVIRMNSSVHPLKFFAKHLLLPTILGAKIKNQADYRALVSFGLDGKNTIKRISADSEYARHVVKGYCSPTYSASPESLYGELMIGTGRTDSPEAQSLRQLILDMVSMIDLAPEDIE